MLDDVAAQSDARPDDMAACLLEVHGGSGAPAVISERVELDEESLQRGRLATAGQGGDDLTPFAAASLPWLKGPDLEWVMGRGVSEWLGWKV